MRRQKRLHGQAMLEFLSTMPFLLATFFLIMATAVVWMQHTMAERLAFEGARQTCAGVPDAAHTSSQWSQSWSTAPITYYGSCDDTGRCVYQVSSQYFISWLTGIFSNRSSVSIFGQSACPEGKFYPTNKQKE
jgi:hypothetical protein